MQIVRVIITKFGYLYEALYNEHTNYVDDVKFYKTDKNGMLMEFEVSDEFYDDVCFYIEGRMMDEV
jgi:hypothetical protein